MTVQVFVPQLGESHTGFEPTEFGTIGWKGDHLVLPPPQHRFISPDQIRMFSLLRTRTLDGARHFFFLIAEGSAAPIVVDTRKIRFNDFPGVANAEPGVSLKNFAKFLCQKCPRLVIDRHTYDYLKGQPVQVLDVPLVEYATACARKAGLEPPMVNIPMPSPQTHMVCPKCGTKQPQAVECLECGVLVSRYLQRQQLRAPAASDHPQDTHHGSATPGVITPSRDEPPDQGDLFISTDRLLTRLLSMVWNNIGSLLALTIPLILISNGGWVQLMFLTRYFSSLPWLPGIAGLLFMLAMQILMVLSLMHYFHAYQEGQANALQALKKAWFGFRGLIGARVEGLLLATLGFFCFVVPGVVYVIRFMFVEALLVIDSKKRGSLTWNQFSHNLGKGYGFAIFGAMLVLVILIWLFSLAAVYPLFLLLESNRGDSTNVILATTLIALGWILLTALGTIFMVGATYLLAVELKRHQGSALYEPHTEMSRLTKLVLVGDVLILLSVLFQIF